MKYLKVNQTTLEFEEIVYVNGTTGDDTTGDGSKANPFSTVLKGFDYMNENCREDGAIVIADGVYNVNDLFLGGSDNLNARYNQMKISLIAEKLGKVKFTHMGEWMIVENNMEYRVKVKLYGIIMEARNSHYHIGGDSWMNEFYNCVFPQGYGGCHAAIRDAEVKIENCIFIGNTCSNYTQAPISGVSNNSASTTGSMEPYAGTKNDPLYNVVLDQNYHIISEGWLNAGEGTNPDGSKAHIGVYGGQFAWESELQEILPNLLKLVMVVGEKQQLSVHDFLSENLNFTWTSSNGTVASVDANGIASALVAGNTIITATAKDNSYTEYIRILVIERDTQVNYQLAVDLIVGETCRLTIDDYTFTVQTTWVSNNTSVATVSEKGKVTAISKGLTFVTAYNDQGKEVGHIYIRVREQA